MKMRMNLPKTFNVARYHSLYISDENFNENALEIIATSKDGTIMAIRHKKYPIYGVQFHPESILTGQNGKKILKNFVNIGEKNEV